MDRISGRCAACKSLRRKCNQNCILAPYFPSSLPQRFYCVHKIFGASNVTKMLQEFPVHLRQDAAESIGFEAAMRIRDPVYGAAGVVHQLQQQVHQAEKELKSIQGQIALFDAKKQLQEMNIREQASAFDPAGARQVQVQYNVNNTYCHVGPGSELGHDLSGLMSFDYDDNSGWMEETFVSMNQVSAFFGLM